MRNGIARIFATTRGSSGSALLVVLIMLGLIAVLVIVVSRSVSGAAREMSLARSTSVSQADLLAGVELGVAAIHKLGDKMRSADASADLSGRRLSVHIANERARIDLNTAPKSMLSALFAATGIDTNESQTLAATIEEWRGGSASQKLAAASQAGTAARALPGLNTFEMSSERSKLPTQTIGTRYFVHPVQLASLPGFSKEYVRSILPYITVASGSPLVDPYLASGPVLEALPGTTPNQVQAFLAVRDTNTSRETALTMLGADKTFLTDTAAVGWRLEIVSTPGLGRSRRREVVIAVAKNSERPFYIVYAGPDEPL